MQYKYFHSTDMHTAYSIYIACLECYAVLWWVCTVKLFFLHTTHAKIYLHVQHTIPVPYAVDWYAVVWYWFFVLTTIVICGVLHSVCAHCTVPNLQLRHVYLKLFCCFYVEEIPFILVILKHRDHCRPQGSQMTHAVFKSGCANQSALTIQR